MLRNIAPLVVDSLCMVCVVVVGLARKAVEATGEANSTTLSYTRLIRVLHTTLYTLNLPNFPSVNQSFYTQSPALVIKTKFI
jgi:hypothetical protein